MFLVPSPKRKLTTLAPELQMSSKNFRLGIVSCVSGGRDDQGRMLCHVSMGRLIDRFCETFPNTKLALPVLPQFHPKKMNYQVRLPEDRVVALPPLGSVLRSQRYYFQTRRILKNFARSVDVLFIRTPFQLPAALRNLGTPKLVHVVGDPAEVVAASNDYRGLVRRLALVAANRSNATLARAIAEPMTRAATNGQELWDRLGCRAGRVVVSSCISESETPAPPQLPTWRSAADPVRGLPASGEGRQLLARGV